ncbi:hypothetical protein DITRI_Ditri20bG0121900 [Diplodiscus trichospermus]
MGANGGLCVGLRRLVRQQAKMPSSVISSHSTHLGVLATASHAIATRTQSHKLSVGMRFKMRFEGEEVPERRFSGTIVSVGDNQSSGWADSEWRCLKVQWDEHSSIMHPDRVSPWELEPLVATSTCSISQLAQRNKRAQPPILPSPSSNLSSLGKIVYLLLPVLSSCLRF